MRSASAVRNGSLPVSRATASAPQASGNSGAARQFHFGRAAARQRGDVGQHGLQRSHLRRPECNSRRSGRLSSARKWPSATSSTCTRLRPVSTKAGILPVAASTMMRPVGVGLMSRGPMGVEGATITAGKPLLRDQALDFALGHQLAALVGADHALRRVARGFVHRLAMAGLQGRDRGGIDHPLHAGIASAACMVALRALQIVALDLARDRAPRGGNRPRHGRDSARLPAPRSWRPRRACRPAPARTSRPAILARDAVGRISTRTCKPRATSAARHRRPTKPDAPVTRTMSAHGRALAPKRWRPSTLCQ